MSIIDLLIINQVIVYVNNYMYPQKPRFHLIESSSLKDRTLIVSLKGVATI